MAMWSISASGSVPSSAAISFGRVPSPAVSDELRERLGAAGSGAKAVGYRNVGTVEFL